MLADSEGGYTPYLAINNRGNDGSGQGWAASFSVMYNCQVPQFQLEQLETTTNQYNWTIGGIGSIDNYGDKGIYDKLGTILGPRSLYLEQLKERAGPVAVQNIGYAVFNLSAMPSTFSTLPGNDILLTVNVAATNYFNDTVNLNVTGLPSGTSASFSSNLIAGSGSSTLTIFAPDSVAQGNYPLTINAIDGNLTNSVPVILSVAMPTSPVFSSLSFTGSNLVFSGSNGVPNWNFYLLETTNLPLPLSQWKIIGTNTFDGNGNFVVTNSAASSAPENFYLLKLQ